MAASCSTAMVWPSLTHCPAREPTLARRSARRRTRPARDEGANLRLALRERRNRRHRRWHSSAVRRRLSGRDGGRLRAPWNWPGKFGGAGGERLRIEVDAHAAEDRTKQLSSTWISALKAAACSALPYGRANPAADCLRWLLATQRATPSRYRGPCPPRPSSRGSVAYRALRARTREPVDFAVGREQTPARVNSDCHHRRTPPSIMHHAAAMGKMRPDDVNVRACTACSSPFARPKIFATCFSTPWTRLPISAGNRTSSPH